MAIEKAKYLVYLVSKKPGITTLGVVRESDTMMHIHTLERSGCIPGTYTPDGENTLEKASFGIQYYEVAFSEQEAFEMETQIKEAQKKVNRVMSDD